MYGPAGAHTPGRGRQGRDQMNGKGVVATVVAGTAAALIPAMVAGKPNGNAQGNANWIANGNTGGKPKGANPKGTKLTSPASFSVAGYERAPPGATGVPVRAGVTAAAAPA